MLKNFAELWIKMLSTGRFNLLVKSDSLISNISKADFEKKFENKSFSKTKRHGKHLFIKIKNEKEWLENHFGMTGSLKSYSKEKNEPQNSKIIFKFSDSLLAYTSVRKFVDNQIVKMLTSLLKKTIWVRTL